MHSLGKGLHHLGLLKWAIVSVFSVRNACYHLGLVYSALGLSMCDESIRSWKQPWIWVCSWYTIHKKNVRQRNNLPKRTMQLSLPGLSKPKLITTQNSKYYEKTFISTQNNNKKIYKYMAWVATLLHQCDSVYPAQMRGVKACPSVVWYTSALVESRCASFTWFNRLSQCAVKWLVQYYIC